MLNRVHHAIFNGESDPHRPRIIRLGLDVLVCPTRVRCQLDTCMPMKAPRPQTSYTGILTDLVMIITAREKVGVGFPAKNQPTPIWYSEQPGLQPRVRRAWDASVQGRRLPKRGRYCWSKLSLKLSSTKQWSVEAIAATLQLEPVDRMETCKLVVV